MIFWSLPDCVIQAGNPLVHLLGASTAFIYFMK